MPWYNSHLENSNSNTAAPCAHTRDASPLVGSTDRHVQNLWKVAVIVIVSNCLLFLIILVTMFDRYLRSIQTATPIETSHSIDMVVQHCYSKSASKSIYIMRLTSFRIPFHPKLSSPPSPSLHACDAAPTICSWVVNVHCSYLNDFCWKSNLEPKIDAF